MINELIVGRRIAGTGTDQSPEHGVLDPHHSAEDWRAFWHALDHRTVFERRIRR